MGKLVTATMSALFVVTLAAPVASVVTSTEAAAWPKHKKCVDWCTSRSGHKFRLSWIR